jgi:hypothetical protein
MQCHPHHDGPSPAGSAGRMNSRLGKRNVRLRGRVTGARMHHRGCRRVPLVSPRAKARGQDGHKPRPIARSSRGGASPARVGHARTRRIDSFAVEAPSWRASGEPGWGLSLSQQRVYPLIARAGPVVITAVPCVWERRSFGRAQDLEWGEGTAWRSLRKSPLLFTRLKPRLASFASLGRGLWHF